jgi:hypothetical protein
MHRLDDVLFKLRRNASSSSYLRFGAALGIGVCLMGASQAGIFAAAPSSIGIERQVVVPGPGGRPSALTRTKDGGYVVVGAWGVAWAVHTDANGQSLWKYEEPKSPGVKSLYQSEFHSVVALSDGGALLCGEATTEAHRAGTALLVRMDADGHMVEHRTDFLKNGNEIFSSTVHKCIAWGDGFAVTGAKTTDQGLFWLARLDKNGVLEWEISGADVPGFNALAISDGSLVVMGNIAGVNGHLTIVRVNTEGSVLDKRTMDYVNAKGVRADDSTGVINLVAVDAKDSNTVLSLDSHLKDARHSVEAGSLSIRDGCAYRLSDGSIALFGNKFVNGNEYRSAIGRVNRGRTADETNVLPLISSQDTSFSVRDAVQLSPNQFIALVESTARQPNDAGFTFSWVTFK